MRFLIGALCCLTSPALAQQSDSAAAHELRLARSAAPAHVTAHAAVYLLRGGSYRLQQAGSNGFACLVEHEDPRTTEPVCYDAAGAEAFLPVAEAREQWRAAGVDEAEIRRRITEGFAAGRFHPPRRPGVAYMLAEEQSVRDESSGNVSPFVPHLMFYAANLSAAELGLEPVEVAVPKGAPFLVFERDPRGLVIVPFMEHQSNPR